MMSNTVFKIFHVLDRFCSGNIKNPDQMAQRCYCTLNKTM